MINVEKLKCAEHQFMTKYPQGFGNLALQKMLKKHKMEKMIEMVRNNFSRKRFRNINEIMQGMIKVVNDSPVLSMFEKVKFKDFVGQLTLNDKALLVKALSDFLHGNAKPGFEAMVEQLKTAKLAKWSLLTIIPAYHVPNEEVFIKPTEVKCIIKLLEIDDLVYGATPSWSFYTGYRAMINETKKLVDSALSPSNAAFSSFLMMSDTLID